MKNYNFNTQTGTPITLNGSDEPAFYIDANDMTFIEKATELYREAKELQKKAEKVQSNLDMTTDANGVPKDSAKMVKAMNEQIDTLKEMLDELLGEGVCEKVFQGKRNIGLLINFLNFLADVIQENRKSDIGKYAKSNKGKGVM